MVAVTAPVRRVAPPHAPPPHSWSTPLPRRPRNSSNSRPGPVATTRSTLPPLAGGATSRSVHRRRPPQAAVAVVPLEADLFDGDTLQNKSDAPRCGGGDRSKGILCFEVFAKTRSASRRRRWSRSAAATRCSACSSPPSAARSSVIVDTRRPKSSTRVWAVARPRRGAAEADLRRRSRRRFPPWRRSAAADRGLRRRLGARLGSLTDAIIDAAVEAGAASLAVMPCCYAQPRGGGGAARARKSLPWRRPTWSAPTRSSARYATTWRTSARDHAVESDPGGEKGARGSEVQLNVLPQPSADSRGGGPR